MQLVIAGLGAGLDWSFLSLSAPCTTGYHNFHRIVHASSRLATPRERRSRSSVTQPVFLAYRPRSLARPRQRYHPQPLRFLCIPRPWSWRGSPRGAL
jgi:hypothetical protein